MSFFGFDQPDLEKEKRRFLEADLNSNGNVSAHAWGEGYDGLGDALQEGGDELNDETFGGIGAVGKDFDFSNPKLPDTEDVHNYRQVINQSPLPPQKVPSAQSPAPVISLESIWDDKSPFSLRLNGATRTPSRGPPVSSTRQSGIRTLQEIEAEMRAAAEQSREAAALQQRQQQLLQQQQREEEEFYFRQRQQEQQEQELRQRLLYQQEQQQLQQLQRLQQQQVLQQQREQQQHHRTPPPRMLPVSQSPRFLEHQRQILLLQQQQEQQQLVRLQQLEEQLRVEELERQLRAQQISSQNHHYERQQPSGPTLAEMEARHQQQQLMQQQLRQRSQSPAARGAQHNVPLQDSMPFLPQNIQLQQRLLSEMAQAEFFRDIQGLSQADQEALRMEAMRKILETEKMEEKRRRKAAKIAHMSRYNDLMTQSDKDFITRIQVSQLVSQDPYADDFYAQVYGAIMRSRMGLGVEDERVLKFGASGGVGLGAPIKGNNRRPSAMQRMQQQVERIVSNARKREEEKGLHAVHSLQGALGKTSGRSYKASPRQLLQVDSSNNGPSSSPTLSNAQPHPHISKQDAALGDAAAQAAKLGREALGDAGDATDLVRRDPLTSREVLVTLETLYDLVMGIEQLRHDEPHPEEEGEAVEEWQKQHDALVEQIWIKLQVMVPLETSNPHPFISLLSAAKGKKLLPRVTRNLDNQRMFTLLTLLIACFSQLDVIADAPILESPEDTPKRANVERQTQAFLSSVMQSILPTIVKGELRLVTGLLGLLMDRNDVVAIARTKPGIALLTLLLTRVELIKQSIPEQIPSPEDAEQWQMMFDHLFQLLTPHFAQLFPTRVGSGEEAESHDQPVWQFLAALALHATTQQHQILVTSLREKVLENVLSAKKGWGMSEEERQAKLANVDLFLHAIGLESSQIAV
ncbi:DNA topoisomerase 2-associated protein pat1 [Stygiomarasmius scandens]|uniref:DNA topoisomerase 2-associated protein pat1 n=1 Tax=Marasmiellus scandens TaxID=2682957 RepID=A0ABR1K7K8_9AGAR